MFLHTRATKATYYATWIPLFDDGMFYRAIWELRTDYRDRITGSKYDQHLSRERSTVLKRLHVQRINASEMRQAMDEGLQTSLQRAWDATLEFPPPKESYFEEEARRHDLGIKAYGMASGEHEDEDPTCERLESGGPAASQDDKKQTESSISKEYVDSIPAPDSWQALFAVSDIKPEMWTRAARQGIRAGPWKDLHDWVWTKVFPIEKQKLSYGSFINKRWRC